MRRRRTLDGGVGPAAMALVGFAMTLIWLLVWFIAGHEALVLDPVNAWAATLILAVGVDLARPNGLPGRSGHGGDSA